MDYKDMIKRALVLKYILNQGGRKTKGKWKTKGPSRRDGVRQWNADHPDHPVLLRVKTGSPKWFQQMKENSSDS